MQVLSTIRAARPDRPLLTLAPMDGVLDPAARATLCPEGGYDLASSEFVRVVDRPLSPRQLLRTAPELAHPAATPVLVQLLGSHPQAMADSAALAISLGAPGVDLNFGCPARRVNGHGGGAALLRAPAALAAVVAAVRAVVPADRSLSAKLRLGWDDPDDALELCRRVADAGADFISLHGRTRVQQYGGRADWARVAQVADALPIPVIASGDVIDPQTARACAALLPRPCLMLGRGALRTPNLARWIRGWDAGPEPPAQTAARLRAYAAAVCALPGLRHPERAALARIKQWLRMLSEAGPPWDRCFADLRRADHLQAALDGLPAD